MSKPIDQELLPCPFCGDPNPNLTHDDYVHDDMRPMAVVECTKCHTWVQAEAWNKRAAVQPAGVVVAALNKTRDQWQKVDARFCADNNSPAANMHLIKDAQRDIELLHRALAAAPHPVSGEPTTDELHRLDKQCRDDVARAMGMSPVGDGYPWSGLLAGIKIMAARPKAQDVAGLVEALEAVIAYDDSAEDEEGSLMMHYADMLKKVRAALAAHRAQQGEQP